MPDSHDRRARLAPVYLTAFPMLPLAAVSVAALPGWLKIVSASWFAVPYLLEEFARDRGKRLEPELWASWGGGPALSMLRWSQAENPVLMRERHRVVEQVAHVKLPSEEEEKAAPDAADNIYDAAVDTLLVVTKKKDHPLLQSELARYGLRRNLWGMKPTGVAIALLVVMVSTLAFFFAGRQYQTAFLVSGVISLFALVVWVRVITPEWIRRQSRLYAIQFYKTVKEIAYDESADAKKGNITDES